MSKLIIPTDPEVFDLFLSQTIDRYNDMPPDEAHEAIGSDWHEQMAAVIEAAMFQTPCGNFHEMAELLEIARENGHGIYFVPICSCEWDAWRRK
ncbi:MAG: hypothetical protein P4M13_02570 [Alphaproteobacteria bacterium]|nr:hypothetical protein [Alphaproteobacteria bacterium]